MMDPQEIANPQDSVLKADDLCVELGGLPVLRGVSFAVGAGDAVALLGGNGSGKTTLVRALVGLVPAARGTVELFGTPLRRFRSWSRIGYVPQRSTSSLGGAKVREVVASGRLAHRRLFMPAGPRNRAAVMDALDAVDLADRAGDEMAHLSGGQQQRVLIARALAGEPDLLVLDEPTAGVDLEHQQVLAQLLGRLVDSGTAALVVLHEIGPLGPLIGRAVLLREGRIVRDGPLEDTFTEPFGTSTEPVGASTEPVGASTERVEGRRRDRQQHHPSHEHEPPTRTRRLLDGAADR